MRVAVLDDYQQVARRFVDWASLGAEVTFLDRPLPDDEAVAAVGGGQPRAGADLVRRPTAASSSRQRTVSSVG
ncbi:hypothetical protein GCM10009809_17410 [Isoptericola hypogeus]|uniref:D-isomer specific 2-hydroxyacid dehydrogenase-like protein n=1 Tax=Isoptericola hypogeus TaxID=300179 RepID=A0ABN2JC58_9MICO